VGVVTETFQKLLGGLVQHGVVGDFGHPILELGRGGQFSEQDEIGHFEERALLGQLLDGVAPVAQDTLVAIDEGDGATARRRVHESRVIGHEPEVVGAGFEFAQVHGTNCPVLNGNLTGSLGTLID
jgi:hypothetical protein